MKNSIFLAVIFGLLFTSHCTLAQWQLGGEAGFQVNDTRLKGAGDFIGGLPKAIITPSVKLTATYHTSRSLAFKTGLGYSQKGFQVSEGLNVDIFKIPVTLGAKLITKAEYVDIPLEAIYSLTSGKTKLFVSGGAQLGYATVAKIQPRATVIIDINLPEIPVNLNQSIYNRFDISGTAGLGLIQDTGNGNLIVQGRYVHSFTNFLNNPIVDLRVKPYSFEFSLGYQMPIKAPTPRA